MIGRLCLIHAFFFLLVSCEDPLDAHVKQSIVEEESEVKVLAPANLVAIAEESFDASLVSTSLQEIYLWHEQNNPSFLSLLNRGLSADEIQYWEDALGRPLTDELRILYSWHNGTEGDMPFIWYHRFIPLEEAVSLAGKLARLYEWESGWIPVFEFEGEYYFVKLTEERREALPVYLAFPYSEHAATYINLTKLLITGKEILEAPSVIEVEQETGAMLKEDIAPIRLIFERNNPGMKFPYR